MSESIHADLSNLIVECDKIIGLAMEGFHFAPEALKKTWGRLIDRTLDERLRLMALRDEIQHQIQHGH